MIRIMIIRSLLIINKLLKMILKILEERLTKHCLIVSELKLGRNYFNFVFEIMTKRKKEKISCFVSETQRGK